MDEKIAQKLLEKVKSDYSKIAIDFADTRQNIWPEMKFFEKYFKDNDRILDLGCGSGRLYKFITEKNVHYTGLDNNNDLLIIAKKNNLKGEFKYGDQLSIPFKDETFDCIFNIASFHHIPSDILRKRALYEMLRVLKKNGYLILTAWNLFQEKYKKYLWQSFLMYLFSLGKFGRRDVFVPWSKSGVQRYYYAFKFKELENLLKLIGFEIVESFCAKKGEKVLEKEAFNFCFVCQKK
jgi:ubiquinone/menaquinone biosynthesis C-methylase UbiE